MMQTTSPKAVFFDMDGILYDSMGHHAQSWTTAFAAKGIPYSEADAYRNEGRTSTGTIQLAYNSHLRRNATEDEVEAIYQHKTRLVTEMAPPQILPGMAEFVRRVQEEGIKVLVVTGSKQPSLLQRLQADFGIAPENVISGKDVTNEKPHPEPYLRALERSKTTPAEAMVIENAPLGVQSAKSAGIFTVAVNTGPLPNEALAGADIILSGTIELDAWWEQIKTSAGKH